MRLAQISPNRDVYSETFIQNHKLNFEANVCFYYGGYLPDSLEGYGYIRESSFDKLKYYISRITKKHSTINLKEKAFLKSLKKNKIDIVFAEYGPTGVAVLNVCKKINIPLIVNFHGYDASMYDVIDTYKDKYREMFEYAHCVIAVSKEMAAKLKHLGCPENKLAYIPYGPNNHFLKLTPQYAENAFLAVGRFVDKKAPYYTILSFKKVVDSFPEAKLYMAGDGALLETCRNLSKYLKLDENIVFLGKCPHQELLSYYAKVKAFVQHSITPQSGDMEGTPVAILEASAAALPVIATKHAGIKDIIIEGKTGFLVEEHDVDLMAEKMMILINNDSIVKEIGKAGRENIEQHYTIKIQMDKINSIIRKCTL